MNQLTPPQKEETAINCWEYHLLWRAHFSDMSVVMWFLHLRACADHVTSLCILLSRVTSCHFTTEDEHRNILVIVLLIVQCPIQAQYTLSLKSVVILLPSRNTMYPNFEPQSLWWWTRRTPPPLYRDAPFTVLPYLAVTITILIIH